MPENRSASTEELYRLSQLRLGVLVQLRDLTLLQVEYVQIGDAEGLLSLLGKKQHLVDEIQDLQSKLAVYQSDDPDARVWQTAERRLECRRCWEEGKELLAQILEIEGRSIDTLSQHRDIVASELQFNHSAQAVQSAYTSHQIFEAEMDRVDRMSEQLSLEG